eukprot:220768_1
MAPLCLAFACIFAFISVNGLPPSTCNYVKWGGSGYAMDVCMITYGVDGSTYYKYVCEDEIVMNVQYNKSGCTGPIISSTNASPTSFKCDAIGDCKYLNIKYHPNGCDSGGYSGTWYQKPYITDSCFSETTIKGNIYKTTSYIWDCEDTSYRRRTASPDYDTTCSNVGSNLIIGHCDIVNGKTYTAVECGIKHYGPSNAPTEEPSVSPTTVAPTQETESPTTAAPTQETNSPTKKPTISPSTNPTDSPTKTANDPNAAVYTDVSYVLIVGLIWGQFM